MFTDPSLVTDQNIKLWFFVIIGLIALIALVSYYINCYRPFRLESSYEQETTPVSNQTTPPRVYGPGDMPVSLGGCARPPVEAPICHNSPHGYEVPKK